jgi:hypothetical protein
MERTMSTLAYGIAKKHELLKANLLHGYTGVKQPKSLSCDVVFGSPSVGCRGTGICKLNVHDGSRTVALKQTCRGAVALLVSLDEGEGVSLILPHVFLCTHIVRHHLRHGIMQLNESCTIPNRVSVALGLKIKALEPGIYPVQNLKGFYRIDFK